MRACLPAMPGAVVTTMPLEDIAGTVSRLVAAGISVEGVHKAAPYTGRIVFEHDGGEKPCINYCSLSRMKP